jgi:thymidylate synthase
VPTRQGPPALTLMQQAMRFDLVNGFPMITERSLKSFWRKPIGELCAFINGATTLTELAEFGCDWWGPWASEQKCASRGLASGDLGPGSYGHAFRHFTTDLDGDDEGFDQLGALVRKLRDLPDDRTAVVSPWIPQANHREQGTKSRNTIAPCHGWVHALVFDGKLHLVHNQRSGDTPIGVPSNMVQYNALGLMLEHLTGCDLVEYVHWIQYAHIYVNQLPHVEQMLAREPRRLPGLRLNEEGLRVSDIHGFRAGHFEIDDYDPHPPIAGIPVLT